MWVWLVPLLVLVVGGGAAALFVLAGDDFPSEWDPRVRSLARFAERERGLRFDHPVPVDFLPEAEFRKEVTTDEDELTDEDREDAEAFEAAFRAMGLFEGDVDLLDEANTLSGEDTLAYYDTEEDRIVVRGTRMTVGLKVTLVHELTHALQDQHFNLSRLDDEDLTSGEYAAFEALVEGDAQRIEYEYIGTLSDSELADYEEEYDEGLAEAEEATEDVPEVLQAYFSAPYQLGEALLGVLDVRGGNDAVDDAFEEPPSSEEHLLDPWTFVTGDDPEEVGTPKLQSGEEEVDSGDFGAITWFLALAERIDARRALAAVDGWGGDSYVLYKGGGRTCVRLAFRGDTERDVDEMESALADWVEAMPPGTAVARRSGDRMTLRSCDPGADTDLSVRGVSSQALALPLVRAFIGVGVAESGAPTAYARCVGQEFIEGLTDEQVEGLEGFLYAEEPPVELTELAEDAGRACEQRFAARQVG